MAYPTIPYDATSGSDTAPTGNDGSGTNGDWSTTTLTLNETVDFTGVADDDSDYLWVNTPAGSRKLAQITAFNPSVGACTSITTAQSSTAAYTADSWAVNGTRKTLVNDTSQSDVCDYTFGWTAEFESGTYVNGSSHVRVAEDAGSPSIGNPPITLRAAAGAVSRPVIDGSTAFSILALWGGHSFVVEGLKILKSASTTDRPLLRANGAATFYDCVFDGNGFGASCLEQESGTSTVFVSCYFTGATSYGLYLSNHSSKATLIGCVFKGAASRFTIAAIGSNIAAVTQQEALVVIGCLIYDAAGDGIRWDTDGQVNFTIVGNMIVDNSGDGISINNDEDFTHNAAIVNNIIAFNGAYGLTAPATGCLHHLVDWNATYSNTSGAYNGSWSQGPNGITLTADPFTARGSDNYSLNSTAGGGALCKQAAFPVALPDGT